MIRALLTGCEGSIKKSPCSQYRPLGVLVMSMIKCGVQTTNKWYFRMVEQS